MKKHSKTGVESRFQGTVLGHLADSRPVKIEGGSADTIQEWCRKTRERAVKISAPADVQEQSNNVTATRGQSEDIMMDD